jgi:hypothetical protein
LKGGGDVGGKYRSIHAKELFFCSYV